ncbi:hypothetical protein Ga0074812_102474 [Parafrankia irregularis]|uniref:Uncharacterized protein n=1 Tax=Parafrankia irregularis TaxID=795642 RepID=A0A0S4QG05_9ACTN|nr:MULTISPECIES: hypothetical protein [Parafrankia]MBE3202908.1 hypothetical protein [Parafrankia sp. CH37]CUU54464.1 hypothetical protein Ga0074812_102474 [Parafrankia irregularis]
MPSQSPGDGASPAFEPPAPYGPPQPGGPRSDSQWSDSEQPVGHEPVPTPDDDVTDDDADEAGSTQVLRPSDLGAGGFLLPGTHPGGPAASGGLPGLYAQPTAPTPAPPPISPLPLPLPPAPRFDTPGPEVAAVLPDEDATYRLAPPGPAPAAHRPAQPPQPVSPPDDTDQFTVTGPSGPADGTFGTPPWQAWRSGPAQPPQPAQPAQPPQSPQGPQPQRHGGTAPPPLTGPHPLPPPPGESFTVRRPSQEAPEQVTGGPAWPTPSRYPATPTPTGGGLNPPIPPRITTPGGPLGGLGLDGPTGSDGSGWGGGNWGDGGWNRGGPAGDMPGRSSQLPGPGLGAGDAPEPPTRRGRTLAVIGALAAVVVIVATIGIVVTTRSDDSAETTPAATAPANDLAAPAPNSSAGAGTQQNPASTAASPEEALRSLLNPVTMTSCAAPASSDSAYADATLQCVGAEGVEVLAYHFPDPSALDRQIGARATYYADAGNCDEGQESVEEWTSPQEPGGGARLCYKYADRFVTFWSVDRSLVAFSASDLDPARLVTWWHRFDPIRR